MSPINKFRGIPYWIKFGTSVLAVMFSLTGGLWALEDRYVSEKEAASSLSLFNQKMVQDFDQINIRILNIQYNQITDTYYKYKRLIRENPNDIELKDEFEIIKDERVELKKEINEALK